MNLTLTNLHPVLRLPSIKWRAKIGKLVRLVSPAFAEGHGLLAVEECGCLAEVRCGERRRTGVASPFAQASGDRSAGLSTVVQRTEVDSVEVPKVPRALARGAPQKNGCFNEWHIRQLNVVWMDDIQISKANNDYLHHKGATDVLTFDYGNGVAEILISLDTTQQQARRYRKSFEQELTLYLAHGILHLVGFQDTTPSQSSCMRKEENWIMQKMI